MGDQFLEILRVSHDELNRHVSMAHLAHPNSLESEVFPPDIVETIELHRSVRLSEASRQTGATRSDEGDAFLESLGFTRHFESQIDPPPLRSLHHRFFSFFRGKSMTIQGSRGSKGLAHL